MANMLGRLYTQRNLSIIDKHISGRPVYRTEDQIDSLLDGYLLALFVLGGNLRLHFKLIAALDFTVYTNRGGEDE